MSFVPGASELQQVQAKTCTEREKKIEWLYFYFYTADGKIAGSLSETLLCCLVTSEGEAVWDTDQPRKRL